jgi:AcrR family transcriptional regulator
MAATDRAQTQKEETIADITSALWLLLQEQPLSKISISQVTKKAGTSRQAFYRYFNTLDSVLYRYYQTRIHTSFEVVRQNRRRQHKISNQAAFYASYSKDLLLAQDKGFEHIIQQIFTEEIAAFYAGEDTYYIAAIAAATYAIWRKWLLDGMKTPIARVHDVILRFAK